MFHTERGGTQTLWLVTLGTQRAERENSVTLRESHGTRGGERHRVGSSVEEPAAVTGTFLYSAWRIDLTRPHSLLVFPLSRRKKAYVKPFLTLRH